ncbi:hypothetical protein AMATHDRAFT_198341 [Amanita thiersii Skay4041]|uniref:G-alpha-domain-containing protein n=1 Tax=Amanita thiersii Skay4041 TaxID=703135 RepID=A0A2A9NHP9_9AGAR|nr:hypothetical protein AMATHDRAFT_198341 [Amanita thiersii Skay4041]
MESPTPTLVNPFTTRWSTTEAPDEEAIQRSRKIDAAISEAKKVMDQKKKAVRLLMLGQSESGKSSVLKDFQISFAPGHYGMERAVWKIIIQLNVISQIRVILEHLEDEWCSPLNNDPNAAYQDSDDPIASRARNVRHLRLTLSPLFLIETKLLTVICPEFRFGQDVCVRAGSGWKERLLEMFASKSSRRNSQMLHGHELDPTAVLAASKETIVSLWQDEAVRDALRRREVDMKAMSGFFLDDVERVAQINYEPTNEDTVRARIRTVGAEEHCFKIEKGAEVGSFFHIIDVGGTKYSRATWAPFFDDAHAIIFLAPLVFNQYLEEDATINRLEDSITLWKEICSNKILANADLILFLNKKDVLKRTLSAGIPVKRYIPSYTEPNDLKSVTRYFKDKFKGYHKRLSPRPRPFICHETSAIDTSSMSLLLAGVRDTILRRYLKELSILV